MRIGLAGIDSSHAEDFIRYFNAERRFGDSSVTAFWCHDGDAARVAELLRVDPSLTAAETPDALSRIVDCVIVGCRDGRLHREHALTAIAARRAVFVDKPLATSEADASAIVDAAARAGVPLCSASALRWQDDTLMLKARLANLGGGLTLEASGTWYPDSPYGGAIFYAIHTVELVQELLGTDWHDVRPVSESAVACTIAGVPTILTFAPPMPEGSHFSVTARGAGPALVQRICLPDDYMAPVAARLVRMMTTGVAPLTPEQLLAPVRMMTAIEAALA